MVDPTWRGGEKTEGSKTEVVEVVRLEPARWEGAGVVTDTDFPRIGRLWLRGGGWGR